MTRASGGMIAPSSRRPDPERRAPLPSSKGVRSLKLLHPLSPLSPLRPFPGWGLEGCRSEPGPAERTQPGSGGRGRTQMLAGNRGWGRSPRTTRPVVPRGHFRAPVMPCGVPDAGRSGNASHAELPGRAAHGSAPSPVSAPGALPQDPPRPAGQVQGRARGDPPCCGSCGILRADGALPSVPPDGARPQVCVTEGEAVPSGVCVRAGGRRECRPWARLRPGWSSCLRCARRCTRPGPGSWQSARHWRTPLSTAS